ncbi:MAG: hypothetical protein KDC53_02670 [Saprospiraceae bacterium]|nr:hypothetical protein [Saprospiraceae bacterium]
MYFKLIFTVIILVITHLYSWSQNPDTTNFETFDYMHEGEKYVMQQYFLVFIKRGENKSASPEEAKEIQAKHLAYLGGLYEKGYICMNGPFGDDGEIRGATIYRVSSADEALRLAQGDPAVEAGIFTVEAHPWWLARGTGVR